MTSCYQTVRRLLPRLLISLAVGALVAVVAIVAAWRVYGDFTGSSLTLMQFLTAEKEAKDAIVACLACGGLAALAAAIAVRAPDLGRGGIFRFLIKLAMVTGVSLVLAFVLSLMRIPAPH